MSLEQFLQWLVAGGGSIMAVSFILERSEWFQKRTSKMKDNIIFGASVTVGCGALAIVRFVPPEVIAAITPYFIVVASTFATVFIGKAFHKVDKPTEPAVYVSSAGDGVSVKTSGTVKVQEVEMMEKQ